MHNTVFHHDLCMKRAVILVSQDSLGFTNVLLHTAARNPVYHTSLAYRRVIILNPGKLLPEYGDCGECCPDVKPSEILVRSSLNPNTYMYGGQILYFGFFSCSSLFLYLCADLYVHQVSISLQDLSYMFHVFPDILSYSHCSGMTN